jgi:predicted AlkP superfamily phosphohydrolase/phosphomutase
MVIALDAMEATLFRRFIAEKRLPNLARFAAESQSLDVSSDAATLSGSIWPTFATGLTPGHHGIYFWTQWFAEEMHHYRNARLWDGVVPFWRALGPAGKRAVVIDLPYVPLVKEEGFRGAVGWGLHDELEPDSYPADYRAGLERRFGHHPLRYDTVEPISAREKLALSHRMASGLAQRSRLIEELAAESDWELLIVVAGELHICGHYLSAEERLLAGFDNVDAIANVLEALDEAWPRILAAAGDCHVLLLALQGMVEQREYEPFGAQVLALLEGREPEDWHARPDLLRRLRELLPDGLHRAVWRTLPGSVRAARQHSISSSTFDFRRDRVFTVVSEIHPAVRINLQGRERPGIVLPEEVPILLDSLEGFLREFTTQDNVPAFVGLWRAASEQPGPLSHRLPDALMLTNPDVKQVTELRGPADMVLRSSRREARNGIHNGNGFCYFRPAGAQSAKRDAIVNLDFAPSVLDLLGVQHDRDFMGRSFVS